jgi:hypothetical protein
MHVRELNPCFFFGISPFFDKGIGKMLENFVFCSLNSTKFANFVVKFLQK